MGPFKRQRLQLDAQLKNLPDLLGCQLRHNRALVGRLLDKTPMLKLNQSLAHKWNSGTQLLRDSAFHNLITRLDRARKDSFLHCEDDLILLGNGLNQLKQNITTMDNGCTSQKGIGFRVFGVTELRCPTL